MDQCFNPLCATPTSYKHRLLILSNSRSVGAFLPGVPVQPVTIKYLTKHDVFSWIDSGPSVYVLYLHIV